MYCRMCGNKLGDSDHYCHVCGTPADGKAHPAASAEAAEMKEEVVYNPPFENRPHFEENDLGLAGKESSVPEKEEELKEFIFDNENEIEEAYKKEKSNEFTWNVHEFPKGGKKTEDVEFNWNLDEYSKQEQKETAAAAFEEELFHEIRDDADRIREKNIDRFFTFSRKNEEFQKLLDQEYEKFKTRFGPFKDNEEPTVSEPSPPEISAAETEAEMEAPEFSTIEPTVPEISEAGPTVPEISEAGPAVPEIGETGPAIPEVNETGPAIPDIDTSMPSGEAVREEAAAAEIRESGPDTGIKAEHIMEMALARAQLFGTEEQIKNEEIPSAEAEASQETPAGPPQETLVEASQETPAETLQENPQETPADISEEAPADIPEEAPADIHEEALSQAPAKPLQETPAEDLQETREEPPAPWPPETSSIPVAHIVGAEAENEEGEEEGKHKRGIWQTLLIIIALILVAEIGILGIRYFAPDSAAAGAIGAAQTQIAGTVSGLIDGIKDLFSGKDSDKAEPQNDGRDIGEGNAVDTGKGHPAGDNAGTEEDAPDPNPTADKDALISSQMGNNINIELVKAGDTLGYQQGRDYGLSDLNHSKPIENNIWQTPEKGEPVYYDSSVVGAVIAFDSKWIDYVNGGDKSALDLLKKGSEAYRKAAAFSKVGKIKETFKLLEIGEIRQGINGFYVWAHEEIQITEKGIVTNKKYNWIYCLEPEDGEMKIVNYIRF